MKNCKMISQLSLTGEIQSPVTFQSMNKRVQSIRRKQHTLHSRKSVQYNYNPIGSNLGSKIDSLNETDSQSTNFWPKKILFNDKNRKNKRTKATIQSISKDQNKRRPMTSYKNSFRIAKNIQKQFKGQIKGQSRALIYRDEIEKFKKLYEILGTVLNSIQYDLNAVEKSISNYTRFIQTSICSFIDDFMQGRQIKLQRIIRKSRIFESLSIAYLFLQVAQGRLQDEQTNLINFIGYCLSNLLLIVRIYCIKQKRLEYSQSQFEKNISELQKQSYGEILNKQNDVFLRIQHNNEIITIIHKKLGQKNQKFETCIQLFLKTIERNKHSCSQCSHYIFQYLAMHIHQYQLLGISQELQVAPIPYVAPPEKQYTLVIEPLGILFYKEKTRPYLLQFIEWAHKYFHIVLWTWEIPYNIQHINAILQPYLTSKLYRHHCIIEQNIYTKDLFRLGHNLEKTVIIDFDNRIFHKHTRNGIQCRWKGNSSDKSLLMLCQILQQMISSESSVAQTLVIYAEQLYSIRGH